MGATLLTYIETTIEWFERRKDPTLMHRVTVMKEALKLVKAQEKHIEELTTSLRAAQVALARSERARRQAGASLVDKGVEL